jgi:enoyl-CoA hydratase/carnithine racemase
MADDRIEFYRDGPHLRVVFANDKKPNPIDSRVIDGLNGILDEVEDDFSIRVVSFSGRGGAFAVGADIDEMNGWFQAEAWDELLGFLHRGQSLTSRIASLPAVTIAALNGYALGGGLELALACDIRFAARSAELGFPEVDLGMIPGWGGTQRLPAVVGISAAKDLLVTGRRVTAPAAEEMGLVDRVVDDDALEEAVDDYATTLADKPGHTLRYILDAVETGSTAVTEAGLANELLCDIRSSATPESAARVESFVSDR